MRQASQYLVFGFGTPAVERVAVSAQRDADYIPIT